MNQYRGLDTLLQGYFEKQSSWQHQVMIRWGDIVGHLNAYVCCERIEHGIVHAEVFDYHLMHELFYLRPQIVCSIKRVCPAAEITDIRFRFAGARSPLVQQLVSQHHMFSEQRSSETNLERLKKEITLTSDVPHGGQKPPGRCLQAQEAAALRHIQDDELKKYLEAFLFKCHSNATR